MPRRAASGKEAVYGLMEKYAEKDRDGILFYLTDDIIWVGTAAHEEKFGKAAVRKLLDEDIRLYPTPYCIEISDLIELVIRPDVSTISAKVRVSQKGNDSFFMDARCTYVCCQTENGFQVCSWHASLATALQTEEEYFPISFAKNILEKANYDALTHLLNRATFEDSVRAYLEQKQGMSAFILIDLDNFKFVNDHFGHQCGDEVLIFVADTLKKTFSRTDLTARLGGDEFVVFMPKVSEKDEVKTKIDAFIHNMTDTLYLNGRPYVPSASVGVCFCSGNGRRDYDGCYKIADQAMYQAKNSGKSTWCALNNE